jgi:nitroimidazol reductase NimA-like FMN-containing flavoprotein (pyridoxamine 5'-phosphate oxidase superfamily)
MSDEVVRSIVDGNAYMTLATADEHGDPWGSPVWYATADYREFIWVSAPQRRHSANLAVRPDLGIVIFDSHQPPGTSAAVYLAARAEQVPPAEVERCLRIFSTALLEQGLAAWARTTVEPPARLRLYHAVATEHFVLSPDEDRVPVEMP